MKAWDVYVERGGKRLCVDTVFYVDSASADEIRRGLIEHDGYSDEIDVCPAKKMQDAPKAVAKAARGQ